MKTFGKVMFVLVMCLGAMYVGFSSGANIATYFMTYVF